jgi:Icc-related predicted phosphoesterase
MRVCAVADLHGRLPTIPKCDLLVIAGDICPESDWRSTFGDYDLNRITQNEWLRSTYREWEEQVPATRIVATPGNHDWISKFPEECRSEMYIDQLLEVGNVSIWFTPWVQHCGDWNYQLDRGARKVRFADIPYRLDLLVTHAPAFGCGDLTYSKDPAGCREMRAAIQQKQPTHVVFGHIHEGQRYGKHYRLGGSKLHHASMWGQTWEPVRFDLGTKETS